MAGSPISRARSQERSMSPMGASHDHSVCTWRSGGRGTAQGYRSPELESRAVGYVLEGVAYVGGSALIGAGLFLVMRGNFPTWWRERFSWPLVNITPTVSHLQGAAAIVIGEIG